ncbi:helix-turn-helix transcriptional regulator [Rhodococcus sp. X156]|uniref:helix-turn-helix transcriptional regulator n=1 Tax=Rhodococcus sp. X156 TaxID=2499145 RepID=UPI000FD88E35|nr:helix-turn-helix transcriptional regulator [Rhodococcus sp. X156]
MDSVVVDRIRTTEVSPSDRFAYWERSVSSSLQPVLMRPLGGHSTDFRAEAVSARANGATIMSGVVDPYRSEVTAAQAGHQDATRLLVTLPSDGQLFVDARGQQSSYGRHTLLLQSDDEPIVKTHAIRAPMVLLSVNSAELSIPMTTLRAMMFRPLRVDPALSAALTGAARAARQSVAPLDATGMGLYLNGLVEILVRSAIGRQPDHSGTVAVRRQQARDVVRARLADPALSTATVAAELGISVRRLQQILAGGPSVAQQIRELRIAKAGKMLRDPMARRMTIAEIAEACGYRDHANFSRSFRASTGHTPREYRH